jgi:uncharacterized membrane protein
MEKNRYLFIDYLRGLIIILMGLDHASSYFNSTWRWFDPLNPLFNTVPQLLTRTSSYLCAPGFLMLSGAMVWYSYERRIAKGDRPWAVRWTTIQRGLFLVFLQLTWVNSSWGAFTRLRLEHFGIIASIGTSIALLAFVVHWRWPYRLVLALVLFLVHPLLLMLPYDPNVAWQRVLMEMFVTAGEFNLYPVIPWFALCLLGSVIAAGWLRAWDTRTSIRNTVLLALAGIVAGAAVRAGHGYGNLLAHAGFPSTSFFLFQKYPPDLVHQCWTVAAVLLAGAFFQALGEHGHRVLRPLEVYGSVALFFYLLHIPILAVAVRILGKEQYYRAGGLTETYIAWFALLIVMYPLCLWYGKIRRKTRNPIIRMI